MQDFFISPDGIAVAHWNEAFTGIQVYADLSGIPGRLIKSRANPAHVFWLHAKVASQSWVADNIRKILDSDANHRIVVLTDIPSQQDAFNAMTAGAAGYCHAYSAAKVLKEVREVVLHGGIWLGRDLLQQLITVTTGLVSSQPSQVAAALARLTHREREVAQEAAKGLSNKEIARLLNITERTVKAHISASFERLGVKDRLQLALILNDKSDRQLN
ncbi:Transcriptional regulatory protein DegU [Methylophilaceae bacterium]|nr:Transcriptional regulatory protein DegU [Methylophilaceae bacterium]